MPISSKASDTHHRVIRYFSQSVFRRNALEDILWDIASNCIHELHFVDCVIYLADHDRGILVQKAAYGPKNIDNVQIADPIEIAFGQGLVGHVAQSEKAEICADTQADPRYIVDDAVRLSEITVPILYEGKLLGVIDSEHPEKNFYTQEHLEILESIASICSSKIAHTLAQEAISEHARFFEETPMPVIRIRDDGRLLEHNKASEAILKHWGIDEQLTDKGLLLTNTRNCLELGTPQSAEVHFDDHTYSLLFVPVPERAYCNLFISDVTEITQSRNLAEQANQAKDDFLSVISHEMRTPVNAILGLITLLQKTGLRDDQLQYADSLNFSAKNLLNLINDILDFAKVESGNLELEHAPFELPALIHSAVAALKGRFDEKGVLMRVELGPNVPAQVLGDELRLLQILNNLLQNALKFTPEGSVVLHINEVARTPDESTLRFVVKDTGIGISEDEQERIFAPFSQASVSTTRKYGGTGLGLAIVQSLLDQHHSSLSLESTVSKGSVFSFELTYPVVERRTKGTGAEDLTQRDLMAGKRFLVVDDNDINRMICEEFLLQWGAEVVTAQHGGEAVERFMESQFDLILMDLQMPVCDGVEATRRIRQLAPSTVGSKDYTPILMVTADVFLKRRTEAEQAGVDDFLTKPFGIEELFAKIQAMPS